MQGVLDRIGLTMAERTDRGRVASYIPPLARVDPMQFGMAVALPDGRTLTTGNAATGFSIQSISKVFTLSLALGRLGEGFWSHVGREPSGQAFNSILQLEHEAGLPRNPFINAGAIATTDAAMANHEPKVFLAELLSFVRAAAEDEDIHIDQAVADSEKATGDLNRALAFFMASHDRLSNPVEKVLGTYFHQCAIHMNCRQLARAALAFAGGPGVPNLVSEARRKRINSLMMLCGHYDASGDFAFRVGLPGKSGVGGGILVAAPGRAGIAVWSPGLNAQGNSKLGTEALDMFATLTGWSVFG
ncbi:glutaminase [Salipiger sp. IMCC34102]|nr:glutaminase [Salipiger sp. IMCC34102]